MTNYNLQGLCPRKVIEHNLEHVPNPTEFLSTELIACIGGDACAGAELDEMHIGPFFTGMHEICPVSVNEVPVDLPNPLQTS